MHCIRVDAKFSHWPSMRRRTFGMRLRVAAHGIDYSRVIGAILSIAPAHRTEERVACRGRWTGLPRSACPTMLGRKLTRGRAANPNAFANLPAAIVGDLQRLG